MGRFNFIQVGAGPNGCLQAIGLLKSHENNPDFKLDIYEQRPLEDLEKFQAILTLTEKTYSKFPAEVQEYLLKPNADGVPLGYLQNDTELFHQKVMVVKGADIVRAMLKYLESKGVQVKRGYELKDVVKENGQCKAVFAHQGQTVKVDYDLCTLSTGVGSARRFTERHDKGDCNIDFNHKVNYCTPNIVAWYPLKKDKYPKIDKAGDICPMPAFQVFPFDKEQTYMGFFATGSHKPDEKYAGHMGVFCTIAPEDYQKYENPEEREKLIAHLLRETRAACPQMTDAIDVDNPIFTRLLYSENTLSNNMNAEYNLMITGDANFTAEWVFGSELNIVITHLHKHYLHYVNSIVAAKNTNDIPVLLKAYSDTVNSIIHDSNRAAAFKQCAEPFDHTRRPNGNIVLPYPFVVPYFTPQSVVRNLPKDPARERNLYVHFAATSFRNGVNSVYQGIYSMYRRLTPTATVAPMQTEESARPKI